MDISAVSPEVLVRSTLREQQAQAELEAQVKVVKGAQEMQGDAIMALMGAVPVPQPDGSLGHHVDVRV
ncbi:hypothetical protein [Marinospirillum alkaliphilum]|uniref:Motility protein n=1 Tax=Marinospirillum alkaliphilum DSM 21637 TaxID=1122209 RepID=A0A1K1ZDH9_9GAMM|nr:hypothetical protein [Marinospirillum alkaliphilum]SFX72166.1 hypothetical protein SAMN02745752_02625 [Marinospirillum alkaliphilum DSM 21637]